MNHIESVVSDFDGVVTDIAQEADAYTSAFSDRLSQRVGISYYELRDLLGSAGNSIEKHPEQYGWPMKLQTGETIFVGPATADPYILMRVQADMVMAQYRPKILEEQRQSILQQLYEVCKSEVGTYFRSDAAEYIKALHRKTNFAFVSNSQGSGIKNNLVTLLGENDVRVYGGAKKYEIDPFWIGMDDHTFIDGLARPVYLRRKKYNSVLKSIGSVSAVIGDGWEIDLSLPEAKGINTVLFTTDDTPAWERNHYLNHPNGFSCSSLMGIVERIVSM